MIKFYSVFLTNVKTLDYFIKLLNNCIKLCLNKPCSQKKWNVESCKLSCSCVRVGKKLLC